MRNCLTNTKGLVKIEMQINSTKSDSDFSVVHIYRKLQEKISFLLSLDIEITDSPTGYPLFQSVSKKENAGLECPREENVPGARF